MTEYHGCELPEDLWYDLDYLWARPTDDGTFIGHLYQGKVWRNVGPDALGRNNWMWVPLETLKNNPPLLLKWNDWFKWYDQSGVFIIETPPWDTNGTPPPPPIVDPEPPISDVVLLQQISNLSGYGDALTLGFARWLRQACGYNDGVDETSSTDVISR